MTTNKRVTVTVTVFYWLGTTQVTGKARTYRGAVRLAARNRNAYSPTFYAGARRLIDDGTGLAYADEAERGRTVYAV